MFRPWEDSGTRGNLKRINETITHTPFEGDIPTSTPSAQKIFKYSTKTDSDPNIEENQEIGINPYYPSENLSDPGRRSNTDDSDVLSLLDLPNDAIKLVLAYLHIEDKKNVKLVSKASEKKVLSLDPEMRKWEIVCADDSDEDFEDFEDYLPEARRKHMEEDYFSKIEIFVYMTDYPYNFFNLLMENFINQWKDNIVHLETDISGINFYLLDPELKMSSLQSLNIKDYNNFLPEEIERIKEEKAMIISAFLEKLDIAPEYVEIEESIEVLMKAFVPVQENSCEATTAEADVSDDDVFPLLDLPDDELKLVLNYLNIEEKKNMKLVCKSSEYKVLSLDPEMRKWKIVFNENNFEDLKVTLSKSKIKHTDNSYYQNIEISLKLFNHESIIARVPLTETVLRQWRNNIVCLKLEIITDYQNFLFLYPDLKIPNLKSVSLSQGEDDFFYSEEDIKSLGEIGSSFLDTYGTNLENLDITDLQIPSLPNLNHLKELYGEYIPLQSLSLILKALPTNVKMLELRNILDFNDEFKLDPAVQLKLEKLVVHDSTANVVAAVLKATQATLVELVLSKDENLDYFDCLEEDEINPILNLDDIQLSLIKFTAKHIDGNILTTVLRATKQTLEYLDLSWIFEKNSGPKFNLDSIPLQLKKFKVSRTPAPIVMKVIIASHASLEQLDFHFIHDEDIEADYFSGDIVPFDFGDPNHYNNRWYEIPFSLKKIKTDYISGKVIDVPIQRSKQSLEHVVVKDADDMHGLKSLDIRADEVTTEQIHDTIIPILKAGLMHSHSSELGDAIAEWLENLVPSMKNKIRYKY